MAWVDVFAMLVTLAGVFLGWIGVGYIRYTFGLSVRDGQFPIIIGYLFASVAFTASFFLIRFGVM